MISAGIGLQKGLQPADMLQAVAAARPVRSLHLHLMTMRAAGALKLLQSCSTGSVLSQVHTLCLGHSETGKEAVKGLQT